MHGFGVQNFDKKGVALSVILSLITCGIYGLVWLYQLLQTLYRVNNQPSNAALDIVLIFVTCGIWSIYLGYKMGKLESGAYTAHGLPFRDDSILYVILAIFSLSIVNWAIIQTNINNIPTDTGFGGPHAHAPNQNQPGGPRNDGFF